MEYYEQDDLTEIVERDRRDFEMEITHEAAEELSLRSRGTSDCQPLAQTGARFCPDHGRWLN